MITLKIIKKPRITEKASYRAERNVYTFNVEKSANKTEVKKAIFQIYKVKPVKINILNIPKRSTSLRGRVGQKGGGKKALVYLKVGDKIDII